MNTLATYHFPVEDNDKGINEVTVDLCYRTGNDNPYRQETRGYFASFTPVNRVNKDGYCTVTFDRNVPGFKLFLLPVSRQSKGAAKEARRVLEHKLGFCLETLESDYGFHIKRDGLVQVPGENLYDYVSA